MIFVGNKIDLRKEKMNTTNPNMAPILTATVTFI